MKLRWTDEEIEAVKAASTSVAGGIALGQTSQRAKS